MHRVRGVRRDVSTSGLDRRAPAAIIPAAGERCRGYLGGVTPEAAVAEGVSQLVKLYPAQSQKFDFFILSDSTDSETWLAEELAWARTLRGTTKTRNGRFESRCR